jgi:hypothetical protein
MRNFLGASQILQASDDVTGHCYFIFLDQVWATGVGGGQDLAKVFGPTWMIKIVLSNILQFLSSQTSIE